MSKQSPRKDKSGLVRRLLTVAVVVFFLAAGIYFLLASTRESKRLEQNLIDRFGWAGQYAPAAEGTVSLQRAEALEVFAGALAPHAGSLHHPAA